MRFEEAKEYADMGYYIWSELDPSSIYYVKDGQEYLLRLLTNITLEIVWDYHTNTYDRNAKWYATTHIPYYTVVYPTVVIS